MKLDLRDIHKSFDGHPALRGASVTAPAAAGTLAFIGPSGGGKSTLLRIIGGLESPDAGEVEVGGRPVDWRDRAALLAHRRSLGFVFQAFDLFPHLSALENITLPLRKVHGLSSKDTPLAPV